MPMSRNASPEKHTCQIGRRLEEAANKDMGGWKAEQGVARITCKCNLLLQPCVRGGSGGAVAVPRGCPRRIHAHRDYAWAGEGDCSCLLELFDRPGVEAFRGPAVPRVPTTGWVSFTCFFPCVGDIQLMPSWIR